MEAIFIIKKHSVQSSTEMMYSVRVLQETLSIIFRQAKEKLYHHSRGSSSTIVNFNSPPINGSFDRRGIPCSFCKRPIFFFLQICQKCCDSSHVRCIYHLTEKATKIFKIPSHNLIFLKKIEDAEIESSFKSLSQLFDQPASITTTSFSTTA